MTLFHALEYPYQLTRPRNTSSDRRRCLAIHAAQISPGFPTSTPTIRVVHPKANVPRWQSSRSDRQACFSLIHAFVFAQQGVQGMCQRKLRRACAELPQSRKAGWLFD